MKLLANCFNAEGKPDLVGWMRSFSDDEQAKLEAVLGVPSTAWV
jgi:hypothetical protein